MIQILPPHSLLSDRVLQLNRILVPEIERMEALFTAEWKDELSDLLRFWLSNFKESVKLRTVSYEAVLNTYLSHLETILSLNPPLDEEAMLGSDGRAYGKKFLCLHKAKSDELCKERSPMAPHDPRPFLVSAFTPLREVILFLKKYRPYSDPQIDAEFSALLPNQKEVEETHTRIQQVILKDFLRNQQKGPDNTAFFKALIAEVVLPRTEALRKQIAQNHVARHGEIAQVEKQFQEEARIIAKQLAEVDAAILKTTDEIQELKNQHQYIRGQIDEAKKDNVQLSLSIKETEKAIREKQKGWLKELGLLVGMVLISWGASYALSQVVVKTVPGGFMAGPVLKF